MLLNLHMKDIKYWNFILTVEGQKNAEEKYNIKIWDNFIEINLKIIIDFNFLQLFFVMHIVSIHFWSIFKQQSFLLVKCSKMGQNNLSVLIMLRYEYKWII